MAYIVVPEDVDSVIDCFHFIDAFVVSATYFALVVNRLNYATEVGRE